MQDYVLKIWSMSFIIACAYDHVPTSFLPNDRV